MKHFFYTAFFVFILFYNSVAQVPVMNGISGPAAVCSAPSTGNTYTTSATNSPTSYLWMTIPAGSVSISGSGPAVNITFPNTNFTYTILCYAVNGSGISAPASFTVAVFETPTVTFSGYNPSFCQGSSTNLSASPTILYSASSSLSYTWSPPLGLNTTTGPTVTASPSVTTTYSLQVTLGMCVNTYPITLTVTPTPSVTASINNPTVCAGSSIILNGGGATSYTWTPSAPNNIAFVPGATTSYTVNGTSGPGCSGSAVVGVTVVNAQTIPPVVTPTAICFGTSAVLSAVGATGFTWTPGVLPNAPIVTVSPSVSTTYTLYRVLGPCASTSTINLVVVPFPFITAGAMPVQVCAGASVALNANGASTYTWQPGAVTGSNCTVFPNSFTNYTVTGSVANCTNSAMVPVLVDPSPTVSLLSSTNTICQGQNVSLNASTNGTILTWLPANLSGNSVTVSPNITTLYTASGTNSLGCVATATLTISVNSPPNLVITSSMPFVCLGNSVLLSVVNPSANIIYNWNGGPVNPSIIVSPTLTTSYSVTATNPVTGCSATNAITMTVYNSTFVVTSPTAICQGNTATLTAIGPATSYYWTVNGGITAPSVTAAPLSTTIYSVTGTNGGCQSTRTVNIVVNPLPNVTASTTKNTICRNEVATVVAGGAGSYTWGTGAVTPTIAVTLTVTTTFTVTGIGVNGCSNTATVTQFVTGCVGLDDLKMNSDGGLKIYPNPNNGNFVISSDVNRRLDIFNTLGQLISTLALTGENQNKVTVNNLPNGVYFMTGQDNGLIINKKIVVEK